MADVRYTTARIIGLTRGVVTKDGNPRITVKTSEGTFTHRDDSAVTHKLAGYSAGDIIGLHLVDNVIIDSYEPTKER